MGQRVAVNAGPVTLVTTAETVVCTLVCPTTGANQPNVLLEGAAPVTTGTSTTGVTLRVRQGSLTGAVVGASQPDGLFDAAAGGVETHSIQCVDSPGETAGLVYVLTVQLVGAAANGSVAQASLSATVGALS